MRGARVGLALLGALAQSTPASARGVDARFLMDFAPGITVPIAGAGYAASTGPSFKFSLRTGAELWFNRVFGIAGDGDLGFSPMMSSGGPTFRFRGLVGLRLLIGFRVGAFFIRQAIGVDYIAGTLRSLSVLDGTSALAVEPGFGVQFRFIRHGVVGFALDFPVGFFNFLAADVQMLAFLGLRF